MNQDPTLPPERPTTSATLGLVFGILSLPSALIPIIGFIFGIVGVVCGAFGRSTPAKGRATTGIVLGSLGILISLGLFFGTMVLYQNDPEFREHMDKMFR